MDKAPSGTKSNLPWGGILNLLAAVLYGASPIDLIPDFLVLIGWVDDAIAIPIFIIFAVLGFKRHKARMRHPAEANEYVDAVSREPQIPQRPN